MMKFTESVACIVIGFLTGMMIAKFIQPMWGWFVTPTLGIAVPEFWQLYGLLLVWSLINMKITNAEIDAKLEPGELLQYTITRTIIYAFTGGIVLLTGYLIK